MIHYRIVFWFLDETPTTANKELHKKKLDEVFSFHQKELEELTAKKELTEQQVWPNFYFSQIVHFAEIKKT